MAKDPATLWYWNDWIGGTMIMTRHEKGAYMDLLTAQFNSGHLTETQIRKLLGSDQGLWGTVLREKFVVDSSGSYYNQRLEDEINKRKRHSEKQKEKINKRWEKSKENTTVYTTEDTTVIPIVENENENREEKGGVGEKEGDPLGSEFVAQVANIAWKDQRWRESVCQGQQLTADELKRWMAQYNASICNDSIHGFDERKYKKMFGGWLNLQRSKGYKLPEVDQRNKSGTANLKGL